MKYVLGSAKILMGLSTALVPLTLSARDCGLNIVVLDERDTKVSYKVGSFVGTDGKDQIARFKDLRAMTLPCGTYRYELLRADVNTSSGRITGMAVVEDAHQWITLAADRSILITPQGVYAVDQARSKDYVLRGHVKGLPPIAGPTWIRLNTVAENRSREVEVASDGSFEVYSPSPDAYVIMVLQERRLLAAQYLVITPRLTPTSIEIDLNSPH